MTVTTRHPPLQHRDKRNENTGIFRTPRAPAWIFSVAASDITDGWLVGMLNSTPPSSAYAYPMGSAVIPAGANDGTADIDREFPIVYISLNNRENIVINLERPIIPETDPQGIEAAYHEAPLRGKVATSTTR